MIGQNSSFKSNTNPALNNAITTSSAARALSQAKQKSPIAQQKNSPKKLLLAILLILVIAGAGVAAYILLNKSSSNKDGNLSDGDVIVTEDSRLSIVGEKTDTEVINQFDKVISSSTNDEEKLNATFSKISFMIMSEECETAIAELNKIDESSLSDYDQYRLHNYYVSAYKVLENAEQVSKHQALADEAHERDLASFTLE